MKCGLEFYAELNRLKNGRGKFCTAECRRAGSFTEVVRKKMSLIKKGKPAPWKSGDKCSFWKGGITKENRYIRTTLKMKLWREEVFKRDDWTCVWCKQRGGKLQADHIKSFSKYPALRFNIDNGRTLCVECHKQTDTYGGKSNKK